MRKIISLITSKSLTPERNRWLSFLKKIEFDSLEENRKRQSQYLYSILQYSIDNVPYYHKIAKDNNIYISKENVFEDIRKFPITDKSILRKEFKNLRVKKFSGKYYKNTSGGSTGKPAVFLQDNNYKEKGAGVKLLFYEWGGRSQGEKLIKFWGSERDFLKGSIGIKARLQSFILNTTWMNTFRMKNDDLESFVKIINKKRPKLIESYVQAIYELSKFIKKNNLKIYSPEGIIASAGTLHPEMRKLIESVFECKVLNRYGSREVGDMACSCEENDGLHLIPVNHYIEILDDNLDPSKPGEMGKVYVTSLHNKVMPLIRYRIGDLAIVPEEEHCSCGRGFPLLSEISGRENSIIRTNNTVFDSAALTTSFYYKKEGVFFESFSRYQFVQLERNKFLVRLLIVKERDWELEEKDILFKKLKNILGENSVIDFEKVSENDFFEKEKHQYLINLTDKE
jgi:phenylacetate-CoA ligase